MLRSMCITVLPAAYSTREIIMVVSLEIPNWEGFSKSGFSQIGGEARFVSQERHVRLAHGPYGPR